jgi:FtsZ family, C-terminal domain.
MKQLLEEAQIEAISLRNASCAMLCLRIPKDATLHEVSTAAGFLTDAVGEQTNVIFGSVIDDQLEESFFEAIAILSGFQFGDFEARSINNYLDNIFSATAQIKHDPEPMVSQPASKNNTQVKKMSIFVASPSDVTAEREAVKEIISNLNDTVLSYLGLYMELISWESHAVPDMGRPQAIVNRVIEDIDIFIGILWSRIGTPTEEYISGTLEEFEKAYRSWKKTGSPRIMFYFCDLPPKTRGVESARQFLEVEKFREEFPEKGLYWTYTTVESFANIIRNHLTRIAYQIGKL